MSHLHAKCICHRDLKPANLLVSNDNRRIVLCDFGCAEEYPRDSNPMGLVSNTVGTPAYWAPECIYPDRYQDTYDVGYDIEEDDDHCGRCNNHHTTDDNNTNNNFIACTTKSNEKNKQSNFESNNNQLTNHLDKKFSSSNCKRHNGLPPIMRYSAYGLDMWSIGVILFGILYKMHPFLKPSKTVGDGGCNVLRTDSGDEDSCDAEIIYKCQGNNECNNKDYGMTETELFNRIAEFDPFQFESVSPLLSNKYEFEEVPSEYQAILEGLLAKEPSMRWSIGTLAEMPTFI